MRNSLLGFALVLGGAAGFPQTAPPAVLPDHTPVEIELGETISSETLHAGQQIRFKVLRDVIGPGGTVLPAGMSVTGEVSEVQSAGAFRKAGSFELRLRPLRLDDGSTVQLEFPRPKIRSAKGEKTATGIAAVPVLMYYFPFIPFAVVENSKKGAAYTVRAGERYLVYSVSLGKFATARQDATAPPKAQPSPQ
jgi:hypothetical protein